MWNNTKLKRKTPLQAKKPLSQSKLASKRIKGAKRKKLPTIKTVRNRCDKLLTPIIKLMYPRCIFTGQPTEVAHHAIKKSSSSALRYYIPNLIPLTHKAHMRLHADETLWTGKLIELKGMEWWQDLMEKKEQYNKSDVHWYLEHERRLLELKEQLENSKNSYPHMY